MVEGKIALVTGGAGGIGFACVEALAREGAHVIFTDLTQEAGEAALSRLAELADRATFLLQDVTQEARWGEIVEQIIFDHGQLDILINNAGIFQVGDVETVDYVTWKRILAVNLDSVFLGTQAAIARMKETGGSIINIASIDGLVGHGLKAAYCASKGGVKQFTKAAALHCAQAGYPIRINSVCPGYTMTPLVTNAIPDAPEGLPEAIMAATPMGRFGDPAEIAQGVLYLASDKSSFVTGTELVIDGGFTAQ